MRLSIQEVSTIKKILQNYAEDGKIYLHGSRIDDNKKGGDIDLFFVVNDAIYENIIRNRVVISAELSLSLHEQKIDLICLSKSEAATHAFFVNSQKIEL